MYLFVHRFCETLDLWYSINVCVQMLRGIHITCACWPTVFLPSPVSPIISTWSSTMKLMKEQAISSGPKDVVSSVSAKIGGVIGAFPPGQLPRGEMQVSNAKRPLACSHNQEDELHVMMEQPKAGDDFVHDIKSIPDPAIVIATERQLDHIIRFCATPAGTDMSILTVDPTFCLCGFECTPVTYRHLLLTTHRYSTSLVLNRPCLIHYS